MYRNTNDNGREVGLHVLCLSHYYPPETGALAARMSEHAEAWVRRGARVTVVTCAPNYPKGSVFRGYKNKALHREVIRGVEVIRVVSVITPNEGVLLRTLGYMSLGVSAILQAHRLPKPDLVFSTSPNLFTGAAGWALSRLKRCPWVLEIRDLWPESIRAVSAIRSRIVLAPFTALARFAYRKADAIVSVTDSFVPQLAAESGNPEKIHVVKNGVDLDAFRAADGDRFRRENGLENKFVAAYVGTHGMAHRLETVLKAAQLLKHREDVAFLLVGEGAERRTLLALRDKLGLGNVVMLGQLARDRMPEVMAAADASLVVLSDTPLFRSVIPSKIFEAMAMRRPVVLAVRGESQGIIEAAGAGLAIAPEDPQALAGAVLELAQDRALCAAMGENGRRCVERDFARERQAGKLLDILRSTLRQSPSRRPAPATGEINARIP